VRYVHPRDLLEPTGDVLGERRAIEAPERPGIWGGRQSDGRLLSQEVTDDLIRLEIRSALALARPSAEHHEIDGIIGDIMTMHVHTVRMNDRTYLCKYQYGGISSDPLIRLLHWRMLRARALAR
jgi:hypothetical protein